jgi:hypothetical protein
MFTDGVGETAKQGQGNGKLLQRESWRPVPICVNSVSTQQAYNILGENTVSSHIYLGMNFDQFVYGLRIKNLGIHMQPLK